MSPDPSPAPPPQEQGISLDELARAFAQVMGTAPKLHAAAKPPGAEGPAATEVEPVVEPTVSQPPAPESPAAAAQLAANDDDCCPISPQSILEAMLFVGNQDNQPLSAARAAELMRDVQPAEIPQLVDQLNQRYAAGGCPYKIVHQGDGYRLLLGKSLDNLRSRFYGRIRQARLSQAAIDVLAIVAYQQPLTADQIGKLRGKPSSHVLSQLVHRGLLRIERETSQQRRITRYYTTERFLDLFNLESIQDLPQSEEP